MHYKNIENYIEITSEYLRILLECIFEHQSVIIHSKKSIFGPQSLIFHQFKSNYWTSNLFNMVDGMKTAIGNET